MTVAIGQGAGETYDIAIIGGGINGCGIARDAAGRGARVLLLEQGDLARGTSSASTKLIHGGLRYLEHGAVGLVREALRERETLWRMAPHLVHPMRFVLPHLSGGRPAWMLRAGLFLYDHLGGRRLLPPTRAIDLRHDVTGEPLQSGLSRAWEYSDCWVDDSRLVILNARGAADRGATVLPHHRLVAAHRREGGWSLAVSRTDGSGVSFAARILVNVAGPAAAEVLAVSSVKTGKKLRLVRGAHIVVPRLFAHDRAYVLQQADGRIVFAIPFLGDFTLIGTTDRDHHEGLARVTASRDEIDYLCQAANGWFRQQIGARDVVWSYAGVRPLVDDGQGKPEDAGRGYRLDVDRPDGAAPMLSVFGGKITTYRRLAEEAVDALSPDLGLRPGTQWTAGSALPGGQFPVDGFADLVAALQRRHAFLSARDAIRIASAYGARAVDWLGEARAWSDLGTPFGGGLTAAEVDYAMDFEWARTADDMLWRRSKLGLTIGAVARSAVADYMARRADA